MRRALLVLAILAAGGGLMTVAALANDTREGGTFRISVRTISTLDPALGEGGGALLDATCAKLFNYPDKPPPQGLLPVPEVATGNPTVSAGGKKLIFHIRKGFVFSDGSPLHADAFAHAIDRVLNPALQSPGVQFVREIVGAEDVLAGKADKAKGVVARGNTLTLTFTRPVPDFPARTAMTFFCAVPPNLPANPEGAEAYPSAGPYYIAKFVRGQRVELERNTHYKGKRPHHVSRFVVDRADSNDDVLDRIERGQSDWGDLETVAPYFDAGRNLAGKYRVNKRQFWVRPGLGLQAFVLNTSGPLFRGNPRLRRAINLAVDRQALRDAFGGRLLGTLTDQYLPPGFPGFRNRRIYPLTRPNMPKAKALARGNLRGRKAVLYILDRPSHIALAQTLKKSVENIGLKVDIREFPPGQYFDRIKTRGEPFDIAWYPWVHDYDDPATYINERLDGRLIKADENNNTSYFDSPRYNRLMSRAARLRGRARYRAYERLDYQLAHDAAPMVAYMALNAPTLVSKRVGCIVLRPTLDLAAACLK